MGDIGSVLQAQGKLDEALVQYEASLAMQRVVHGEGTPRPAIAASLNNIGSVLEVQGKHDEALAQYEAALAMFRQVHRGNDDHPHIVFMQGKIERLRAVIEESKRAR